MMRAARDGGFSVALTAIDPAPRADIEGIGATLIRSTVQGAGLAPFAELAEGDILFIDSSHILMPGTDVDMLFNHVLPALKRGVMVHVHDVFLPDDYPPEWEWRGYNEQLGIADADPGRRLQAAVGEPLRGDADAGRDRRERGANAAADRWGEEIEPLAGEG